MRWNPTALGVVFVAGCAAWPLYNHLPADDDAQSAEDDPRTLFDLTWIPVAEEEPNDDTVAASANEIDLSISSAVSISGVLDRSGWNSSKTPASLFGEACESTGSRSPESQGDYTGDVDAFVFNLDEAGTLCAWARVAGMDVGWDLILFELDACGVPTALRQGDSEDPLGFGLGGAEDGWGTQVEAGLRVGLQLAGYDKPDLATPVAYTLGVALVHDRPDGGAGLCPLPPGGA